ncbi:MAG: lamin tail domain-containing protein [Candidatus Nomurabacteria bacterium]|jgi:hypothetical protein|nr:lamin tail domain-containing protein [Candidatus Nomurabacteria bacterium]
MGKRLCLFVVMLGLVFSPFSVFAADDDVPEPEPSPIVLSRINTANGGEFIELFNTSTDNVAVKSLKIEVYNSTNSLVSAVSNEFKDGYVRPESFVLIKQSGTVGADSDARYGSTNYLTPTGGTIEISIDGAKPSIICWKSSNRCAEEGKLTILSDNEVYVSPACLLNEVCARSESLPSFGGFVKGKIDDGGEDGTGEEGGDDEENNNDNEGGDDKNPEETTPQYCEALRLNELSLNDQWIELYNNSDFNIKPENLKNCILLIQKGETLEPNDYNFKLEQIAKIAPYDYLLLEVAEYDDLHLPKSKNRAIQIIDDNNEYDEMIYATHKTGTSLAYFGPNDWRLTFAPTPAAENVYQQWQTCETGKHINEETGNCIKDADPPAECAEDQFRNPETGRCKKLAAAKTLADCPAGKYRNPETNRCKNIVDATSTLVPCKEGQYRNPETNRCKKIDSDDGLKPCAEGYERNPETNRCRKITSGEAARFGVDPVSEEANNDIWVWAGVGGVGVIGSLVAGQFHSEIGRAFGKIFGRFHK